MRVSGVGLRGSLLWVRRVSGVGKDGPWCGFVGFWCRLGGSLVWVRRISGVG